MSHAPYANDAIQRGQEEAQEQLRMEQGARSYIEARREGVCQKGFHAHPSPGTHVGCRFDLPPGSKQSLYALTFCQVTVHPNLFQWAQAVKDHHPAPAGDPACPDCGSWTDYNPAPSGRCGMCGYTTPELPPRMVKLHTRRHWNTVPDPDSFWSFRRRIGAPRWEITITTEDGATHTFDTMGGEVLFSSEEVDA